MLLAFYWILLVVNQLRSSLRAFVPPSNLFNKNLKIIINQFIEVTYKSEY